MRRLLLREILELMPGMDELLIQRFWYLFKSFDDSLRYTEQETIVWHSRFFFLLQSDDMVFTYFPLRFLRIASTVLYASINCFKERDCTLQPLQALYTPTHYSVHIVVETIYTVQRLRLPRIFTVLLKQMSTHYFIDLFVVLPSSFRIDWCLSILTLYVYIW